MRAECEEILLGFAGDVLIDRDNPREVFAGVSNLLSEPDVLFANLESPYSDAPGMAVTASIVLAPSLQNLAAYTAAGFDVVSMANNHIVDAGHKAMLETRNYLRAQGIATCGAGENLIEARRPALLERRGLKLGFLAYASVFPPGYEARSNVPGLAPLRAYNHYYDAMGQYYAPGYAPRVETIPDPVDHLHLANDIETLRDEVDLLVTSFHWGDHLRPFFVTDHEKRTARFCIDRGADIVVGHHHHALRGIEWYNGKPIFYGLGHLCFDHRLIVTEEVKSYFEEVNPESYAVFPREGWPLLPLHPDTRMTMLGWVRAKGNNIVDVGFAPCRLRPDGCVSVVDTESAEGQEVVKYIEQCNTTQQLNGKLLGESAPIIGGSRTIRVVPNE